MVFRRSCYFGDVSPAARPFVFDVDVSPDTIEICLRVFGVADSLSPILADALGIGLGELGITVSPEGTRRLLQIISTDRDRFEGISSPDGTVVRLRFVTPYRIGGRALSTRAPDILFAAVERVSGLAHWQGFSLRIDWGAVRDAAEACPVRELQLRHEAWFRHSSRQPHADIPMVGLIGHVDWDEVPMLFRCALAASTIHHVGGKTAFGLGRTAMMSV